jgi:branched-chain amino acid aminotransferase
MKKIDWDNLRFEIKPAAKMFVAHHKDGVWEEGRIVDYGPIPLYPSAVVLNYGQGLFEGMKAYRTRDGKIAMFTPEANAKRLNDGCRRLCMPELDEEYFVGAVKALIRENRAYVPPFGKGDLPPPWSIRSSYSCRPWGPTSRGDSRAFTCRSGTITIGRPCWEREA